MSEETVLFESEESTDLAGVAAFLRELADRLEENQVVLRRGEEEFQIRVPSEVTLEIKVEEEVGEGKRERTVEVEIEWTESDEAGGEETEADTTEGTSAAELHTEGAESGGEETEGGTTQGASPAEVHAESDEAGGEEPRE